ncbi:hypothetical protein NP493_1444g01016 [Ridgeia piscesae]|uniref:Uncharacterized protein n=1 Tax=Ridgeia piscesae TaxID=27915 RepID=A0AAD9K308_RIDPI|nr:hypothetical protein NP493_1444g01016 [Ridgeia piscesae]
MREATPKRLRRARVHFSPAARRELQVSKNQYPDYKERSRVAALIGIIAVTQLTLLLLDLAVAVYREIFQHLESPASILRPALQSVTMVTCTGVLIS